MVAIERGPMDCQIDSEMDVCGVATGGWAASSRSGDEGDRLCERRMAPESWPAAAGSSAAAATTAAGSAADGAFPLVCAATVAAAVPKATLRRSEGWWRPHWRCGHAGRFVRAALLLRPYPGGPALGGPALGGRAAGARSAGSGLVRRCGVAGGGAAASSRSRCSTSRARRRCRWACRCRRQTASTRRRTDSARWRSPHGRTCRSSLPIRDAELGTMAERLATTAGEWFRENEGSCGSLIEWPSSVATSLVAPMTWLTSSSVSIGCTGSDRICDVSRSDTGRCTSP